MKRLLILTLVASLMPVVAQAQSSRVIISAEAGFSIEWNGNNGSHFNPEIGAEAPENDAMNSAKEYSPQMLKDGEDKGVEKKIEEKIEKKVEKREQTLKP